MDSEIALNNRPLSYVEDDIQLPILTPNVMMFGQPNLIPEESLDSITEKDLRKRAKYLRRCKDVLWSRWTGEYLKALRERHAMINNGNELTLKTGDVVLIKGEERNRGKWNIGIVNELFKGRHGVVRAVKLRAGKSYLERPIQHLHPLELSCNALSCTPTKTKIDEKSDLNAEASEFRPKRRAAMAAEDNIKEIVKDEESDFIQDHTRLRSI